MEFSRFCTGQVNHASSSPNLAENDDGLKSLLIHLKNYFNLYLLRINLDSVHSHVKNSQEQQRPSAIHVNDNSAHVFLNDGGLHSNAAAQQQRQLTQCNTEYIHASSIFEPSDNKCL